MKNIKHHSIIITSDDKKILELVRKEIILLLKEHMESNKAVQLVSPIVNSLINQYCSFFLAPDGSKEGYDASDEGDNVRKKIIEFLDSLKEEDESNPISFVEIYYGSDDKTSGIVNYN